MLEFFVPFCHFSAEKTARNNSAMACLKSVIKQPLQLSGKQIVSSPISRQPSHIKAV
jgi:hypothetical protein